jgi:hypothetical protein
MDDRAADELLAKFWGEQICPEAPSCPLFGDIYRGQQGMARLRGPGF